MKRRDWLAALGVGIVGCGDDVRGRDDWRNPKLWTGDAQDAFVAQPKFVRWGDTKEITLTAAGATARASGQVLRVDIGRPRLCRVELHAEVRATAPGGNEGGALDFLRLDLDVGCGSSVRQVQRGYVGQPAQDTPLDDSFELVLSNLSAKATADLSTVFGATAATVVVTMAITTVFDELGETGDGQ